MDSFKHISFVLLAVGCVPSYFLKVLTFFGFLDIELTYFTFHRSLLVLLSVLSIEIF